jgi:hypothetical protein
MSLIQRNCNEFPENRYHGYYALYSAKGNKAQVVHRSIGREEVSLHSFFTLTPDRDEWSAFVPAVLSQRKELAVPTE